MSNVQPLKVEQVQMQAAAPEFEALLNKEIKPREIPDVVFDDGTYARVERIAKLMASGKATMPEHLRNNVADCFAIAMQAARWNLDPFLVGGKTHISKSGHIGYEAQLINAVIIGSGVLNSRPEFEFIGEWKNILGKLAERTSDKGGKYYASTWEKKDEDGLGVTVRCQLKGETKPREVTVMMSQAYPRFSTQWATDPQQQITYLAVRKFARRYLPDVVLGAYTPDELEVETSTPIQDISLDTADDVVNRCIEGMNASKTADELRVYRAEAMLFKGDGKKRAAVAFQDNAKRFKEQAIQNKPVEPEPATETEAEVIEFHGIAPELMPEPEEISQQVADWLTVIDEITTLAEIGKKAAELRQDKAVSQEEREQIEAALRARQEAIKGTG